MTYATTNPPNIISQVRMGEDAVWAYRSDDTPATVNTTGYITNGAELGLRVGHVVNVAQVNTLTPTTAVPQTVTAFSVMIVVSVNSDGSVDLSDGTALSVTDTD